MKKLLMAVATTTAVTAVGGYGDLPNAFNESTGYVTLASPDAAGPSGHSSFWDGTYWSDGQPPHSTTNYYAGRTFVTPRNATATAAKLADDPAALTFKGRILVAAGAIYGQSETYEFEIPDLRALPGVNIYWSGNWPALLGTMTTYGTSASPVKFTYAIPGGNIRQPFGMDIKGDASSWLDMRSTARVSGKTSAYHGYIALTGDLSKFYGTLRISNAMDAGCVNHLNNYGVELASSAPNAAVIVETQGSVYATAPGGVEVRSLSIAGSNTLIRLNGDNLSHDIPRFTVRDSVATNGNVFSIALSTHTLVSSDVNQVFSFEDINPNPAEDAALIRLSPSTIANGGFGDPSRTFAWNVDETKAMTEWIDDDDGGMTLWRLAYVTNLCANPSIVNATNSAGAYCWSDMSAPSASKRYFVPSPNILSVPKASNTESFVFGGKSLTLWNKSGETRLDMLGTGYGFACSDLVLRGATLLMCNANVKDPVRKDESGNDYNFYRMQGKIRVPADYTNYFRSYGLYKVLRVESEIEGDGDIVCSTFLSSDYQNDRGFLELTAMNTNYTGKISVTLPYNSTTYAASGVTVPNWTHRSRLFVSDERNLGGRRESFAYDALLLEHYSDLFPLNDVTFTDGWNRGIAIGDVGRMHVQDGITLSILRPLNVNGNLVKEGAGTLALGGVLTFGGSAQSATPTTGVNLLTVAGGAIKPLSANAFDGFAITFTNNAALCVNGTPADAALRQYGLVNTKEATVPVLLAANQAKLPVSVDFGDAVEPPADQWTVGLITLETEKAEALKSKMYLLVRSPFANWRGELDIVSNGDGTSTVVANYKHTGIMLIVF